MFNTGIGQHILKNPLIVNAIIEKVSTVECDFFGGGKFLNELSECLTTLSWYNIIVILI